jgi:hypothetical protein
MIQKSGSACRGYCWDWRRTPDRLRIRQGASLGTDQTPSCTTCLCGSRRNGTASRSVPGNFTTQARRSWSRPVTRDLQADRQETRRAGLARMEDTRRKNRELPAIRRHRTTAGRGGRTLGMRNVRGRGSGDHGAGQLGSELGQCLAGARRPVHELARSQGIPGGAAGPC